MSEKQLREREDEERGEEHVSISNAREREFISPPFVHLALFRSLVCPVPVSGIALEDEDGDRDDTSLEGADDHPHGEPGGSVRGERANFTRLVLGCIDADFCK